MNFISSINESYHRRLFNWRCREVEGTAPLNMDSSEGLVIVSQVYDPDVYMYLVAAKTFARYLMPESFVVVDDGLSLENREMLQRHLKRVEFVPRKTVPNTQCPEGGCWERLLTVADYCERFYVIQLDSDTVTTRAPDAVLAAVTNGTSFTLSTQQGREFVSVEQAGSSARNSTDDHVQVKAERMLDSIEDLSGHSYIRGCAGFTGAARNHLSRKKVERFSEIMANRLGKDVWSKWGSEQFASNYLIANTPGPIALPFEEYPYWAPGIDIGEARLVHFIGNDRFGSSKYADVAVSCIREM